MEVGQQYAFDVRPANSDLSQTLQRASSGVDQKRSPSGFNQRARSESLETRQRPTRPEQRYLDRLTRHTGRAYRRGQGQDAGRC
jgi:hypothetical protein